MSRMICITRLRYRKVATMYICVHYAIDGVSRMRQHMYDLNDMITISAAHTRLINRICGVFHPTDDILRITTWHLTC